MADETQLLAVKGLASGYGEADVISGVDLTLGAGEILAVLGKNGMGKSTLLKTIMGFVRVNAGSVQIDGRVVTGNRPYSLARQGVAYTPQEYTLFQDLTVEENLRLGVPKEHMLTEGLEVIRTYFPVLPDRLRQRAGTLSGGEQKMLLVSRAIIARPRVMLIDEISEGLQPSMIERVADVLRDARSKLGVAILLIEQNLDFALKIADRYAVLKLGEIVDKGTVSTAGTAARVSEYLRV